MEFSESESMNHMATLSGLARSLFQLSLDRMDGALSRNDSEEALQWASLGAWLATKRGPFGDLLSIKLEQRLLRIAAQLPTPAWRRNGSGPRRLLHVFTDAYAVFGHTKLCRKWIELDSCRSKHGVILLSPTRKVPGNLRDVVERQGGDIIRLDSAASLLARAQKLRNVAYENADLVILHVHPDDVLPEIAFGVKGGPPVAYVNHADHLFWVGGMISDVVLDIRESGHAWTKIHRGIPRARIVPIPLGEDIISSRQQGEAISVRLKTRRTLGIPENDIVFLTIGSAYKYRPLGGLSFLEAAYAILESCPRSWIVAIGPSLEGDWDLVSKKTGSRLLALGIQKEVSPFHYAADVYLEGMPLGSLTALLEAGLAGLPCVRAPAQVKPPHASDGIAFAQNPQPENLEAYVREAVLLAGNATERVRRGSQLRERIRRVHCGQAWRNILNQTKAQIPEVHGVYPKLCPVPLTEQAQQCWANLSFNEAAAAGVPRFLGDAMHEAVRRCSVVRRSLIRGLLKDSKLCLQQPGWEENVLPLCFPDWNPASEVSLRELGEPYFKVSMALADLARELRSDGRTCGLRLRMLVTRMCFQRPTLLRNREFAKDFLKVWVGRAVVDLIRKVRFVLAT